MGRNTTLIGLAWLTLAGCGGAGELRLVLSLPDDAAREQTRFLRVLAVAPASLTEGCDALLTGAAFPGSLGYPIEEELEFAYPVVAPVAPLREVGPGRRLFFAEGLDGGRRRILAGCTDQLAGAGGPGEVLIALDWLEECEPTHGGVETCDGLDNDCDQQTDEGAASELCPARARASAVACAGGQCSYACEADWFNANGDWSDGCECQRTLGGIEWCDGVDNDCDGTVDGASCQRCTQDADCAAAGGPCLRAFCVQGVCETEALDPGQGCDDGDRCTDADTCDDQGVCAGTPRVCTDGIDCTDDACDPADGQCKSALREGFCLLGVTCHPEGHRPIPDGCLICDPAVEPGAFSLRPSLCDDGLFCNGEEPCGQDGACGAGAPACTAECMRTCDEDEDACLVDGLGAECDDGFLCTQADACDGEGGCAGVPDDGRCGPGGGVCAPACATEASGCVHSPGQLLVSCDQEVPLGTAGQCRLSGTNGPLAVGPACLGCQVVEQYPVWFAEGAATQDGGCGLRGWSLLPSVCSQGLQAGCPLSLEQGACCVQPSCQQGPPDGALAVVANGGVCGGEGLAFARTVSLGGYAQAYLCLQLAASNLRPADWGIQVEAIDPGLGTRVASDCVGELSGRFQEVLDYCLAVPPAALTWDSAQVVLRIQPPSNGDQFYLRSARLLGMPLTCPSPAPLLATEFWECAGNQINAYPPWQIPSMALCGLPMGLGGVCAPEGGLIVGDEPILPGSPYLDMFTQVDLSAHPQGASLCWVRTFFDEFAPRPAGDMWVEVSSSAGSSRVYQETFSSSNQSDVCERVCVDLDAHGAKHSGQDNVSISFHVDMMDGVMGLNHIQLGALGRCPADGGVGVGPVVEILEPGGGTALAAPVEDLTAGPAHPIVECRLLELASGEGDFRFVLPDPAP